ncbi:MAG: hypothetical protein NC419_10025 [Muribaculaceae bacterium]|nr:hypothetical protein [Muribaculaceae bacterium]
MCKKVKLLSSILCLAILLGMSGSIPVFAAEGIYSEDADTVSGDEVYANNEISPEMEEFYANLMSRDVLQEGEERVFGNWNGKEIYVKVTDVAESLEVAYASETSSSKTFTFYTKNASGNKINLFKVVSECTWIPGNKITRLHCTYTTLAAGVSCSWDDNYKLVTDTHHTLALNVNYAGNSYFIIFGAGLNADRTVLTLTCSEDYDL